MTKNGKPILISYPKDGDTKLIPAGETILDFKKGRVTLPNKSNEQMSTSLGVHGKSYARALLISASYDVNFQLYCDGILSGKIPIKVSDFWSGNHLCFDKVYIYTTADTDISILVSSNPKTILTKTPVGYEPQPVVTLEWSPFAPATNQEPYTDTAIDVSQAKSIYIQVDTTPTGNVSDDIDINVISSPDNTNYDDGISGIYAQMNIGDNDIKSFVIEPQSAYIKLRADNNHASDDAAPVARVYVRQ